MHKGDALKDLTHETDARFFCQNKFIFNDPVEKLSSRNAEKERNNCLTKSQNTDQMPLKKPCGYKFKYALYSFLYYIFKVLR